MEGQSMEDVRGRIFKMKEIDVLDLIQVTDVLIDHERAQHHSRVISFPDVRHKPKLTSLVPRKNRLAN
jgi:hypothetical protein